MSSEKFISKSGELHLIRNIDMHCKDCGFPYENSDVECVKYKQKPLSVIRNGECQNFKKKK
jgi:hypothetical protein